MWLYNGQELADSDIPEKSVGFIYLITQISTGRKYIGRKLLTMSGGKKKVGNKIRKTRKESDWRNYWSSSPQIKQWIEDSGTDDFTREILVFVSSKAELMYCEEYCLYVTNALLKDDWLNGNIRSKIMRKWFLKNQKPFLTQLEKLILDK